MKESKLNSTVTIEIGGEERQLKFTIGAIEELEAYLPSRCIFDLVQKEVWSITEIISATYCALKVFDRKLTRPTVASWITEYTEENDIQILRTYVFAALGLSGLITKDRSAFVNLLNILQESKKKADEQEAEATEGK